MRRNAPVASVSPVVVKLMAGITTRTDASGALVFAMIWKGPPGPTRLGRSTTGTEIAGFTRANEVRFVHVCVYTVGLETLWTSSFTKFDAFGAYHRSEAEPPESRE